MRTEAEEKALFSEAWTGAELEQWKKGKLTQIVLSELQRDAEDARELCTELSPFTEASMLANQQLEVRVFKRLVQKIDAIIQRGRAATTALQEREPYTD